MKMLPDFGLIIPDPHGTGCFIVEPKKIFLGGELLGAMEKNGFSASKP